MPGSHVLLSLYDQARVSPGQTCEVNVSLPSTSLPLQVNSKVEWRNNLSLNVLGLCNGWKIRIILQVKQDFGHFSLGLFRQVTVRWKEIVSVSGYGLCSDIVILLRNPPWAAAIVHISRSQSVNQSVSQSASQWSVVVAVLTGGVVGLMRPPHLLQPQHPHLGCLHNRRSFQSLALCSTHSPTNRNNLCTELEICISCWWWSLRYSQPLSLFLPQFDLDASKVKPSHGIKKSS